MFPMQWAAMVVLGEIHGFFGGLNRYESKTVRRNNQRALRRI
jgi:hypothetical protein